jgi:hypothetical protein
MMSSSAQTLRGLAKDAGLGRFLLRYYYSPKGRIRLSLAAGGPFEQRRTENGRLEMMEAAKTLPPLEVSEGSAPSEINFLTGKKYWYQTLFCAWSMQINCTSRVTPVIYDDGTLTKDDAEYISRAIPWARFVWISEIETLLDATLPANRFPELRRRRLIYPHLRKLTDIHCGKHGWTLVLDSDMLFFREPRLVLEWLAAPDKILHMLDAEPAYGYSDEIMTELTVASIPQLLNVGFCGLKSDAIDWEKLEYWCSTMIQREGTHYFLEQALTAMLAAKEERLAAPASDYMVLPSLHEGKTPTAILHHYVAHSKRSYFQHGWRNAKACHTK